MWVCGFCNVWMCVCADFVMCGCVCVCVAFVMCGCVYVWVCLCVGFVMCGCFGNMCTLFTVFSYFSVHVYLFLFVVSLLV